MKPPKLHEGDMVAIISPSNTIATKQDLFSKARRSFEQATGLKTTVAPNALAQHYYSAGTRQQRLDDFHWALNNPDVKAIIMSTGGDTAIELLDGLDYGLIKRHPKIIAGISDATTILDPILAKTGLITFLGLEFLDFGKQAMPYEVASIKRFWFGGEDGAILPNPNWHDYSGHPTTYSGWRAIRPGVAEGTIIGGNYNSYERLEGTGYLPDAANGILVMECYMFHKKHIHQALTQLKLRGILDTVNGLIVGYNIGSDNPDVIGDDRDIADVILEATDGYDFPIMQIGEIGHCVENIMLPIGARARLDATNRTLQITEPVVA